MDKKLTIENYVPYLPYGLKIKCNGGIITMANLNMRTLSTSYAGARHPLVTCKPLLRPLSDFTHEEWLQVFKAGTAQDLKDYQTHRVFVSFMMEDNRRIFYNKEYNTFYGYNFFDQKNAFREIYRLHGDVEDLIGQGLALPLTNSLK